jgi:NitT/TauT family transport system substrate-binding protein
MAKIFAVLLTIFVFQASVQAADKIRIGFPETAAPFVPLPLGQKRGFFQQEGLQTESILMRPTAVVPALLSGELDYYTVIAGGVRAAIQGLPVKVLACYMPGSLIALIARPEFKSVQELRGKTIGIQTFGGNLHDQARLMFKHFSLDPDKEVKFLALGPTEARFAAMKQGLVAATLVGPPNDFVGKKMGFVVLARGHELFNWPTSGLAASVKKIKETPDEIKRVIKVGIRANRYIQENREGTIQFMMEWLKSNKEMSTATYDSSLKAFNGDGNLPEDGLLLVIEEAKKAGNVSRTVALSDVADLSILREAQRELGIKTK